MNRNESPPEDPYDDSTPPTLDEMWEKYKRNCRLGMVADPMVIFSFKVVFYAGAKSLRDALVGLHDLSELDTERYQRQFNADMERFIEEHIK